MLSWKTDLVQNCHRHFNKNRNGKLGEWRGEVGEGRLLFLFQKENVVALLLSFVSLKVNRVKDLEDLNHYRL